MNTRNRIVGFTTLVLLVFIFGAQTPSLIGRFTTIFLRGTQLRSAGGTGIITIPSATNETLVGTSTLCTTTGVCRATRTLNNTDIRNLPTTPVTVVEAPGAGKLVQAYLVTLFIKATAGAYTNINAAAFLGFAFTPSASEPLGWIPNDAGITNGSATRLTDLLGSAANRRIMVPYGVNSENVSEWGLLAGAEATTNGTNEALRISIDNNGSGNLTGGNAANTLTVVTHYFLETVP